jgi:hypothetical protein
VIERDALVVSTRLIARAAFLSDLGLMPTEHPSGLGEHIKVDPTGETADPVAAAERALERFGDVDGFWIHVDADVLDAATMPAVDSPEPGG